MATATDRYRAEGPHPLIEPIQIPLKTLKWISDDKAIPFAFNAWLKEACLAASLIASFPLLGCPLLGMHPAGAILFGTTTVLSHSLSCELLKRKAPLSKEQCVLASAISSVLFATFVTKTAGFSISLLAAPALALGAVLLSTRVINPIASHVLTYFRSSRFG